MKATSTLGWMAAAAAIGWIAAGTWESRTSAAEKDELVAVSTSLADAYVTLAELDLQNALDANKKIAESFTDSEVERLKRVVEQAQARAAAAKNNDQDAASFFTTSARDGVKVAEAEIAKAKLANEAFAGTVGALEMKRLETNLAIAKLRVKQLDLLKSADPNDLLRWEVDYLAAELSQLKTRVLNFSIKN